MNFIFAGLNIANVPVEVLERVTVPTGSLKEQLDRLAIYVGGGVILSTCNRIEIYAVADDLVVGVRQLREFIDSLARRDGMDSVDDYIHTLAGDDVANHLFSVAAGLESIALGESQIIGQVSRALRAAGEAGTVEPSLSRMFHSALRTSRRIRSETEFGRNRVSVPSLGVQELQSAVGDIKGLRVLLVGAGETGKLTASALRRYGVEDIVVCSRSMDRGAVLADELGSKQIPFEAIPDSLVDFDILITSTAATEPVISSREVRNAMAARPNRHLHVLDVGMPRDVDPESASIEGVHLISLTDLQKKSSDNWELREEATLQARGLIEDGIRHFKERLTSIHSEPVIRTLGARVERMRQEEVERTLGRHEELTEEQAAAVEKMTRSLVRRILSDPISFLRSDEDSAADLVQKIFALKTRDAAEDEVE